MRSELEHKDIEAIAQRVTELLLPQLTGTSSESEGDEVFDVKALATYLSVTDSWVYDRVKEKSIPYIKVGHYLRFRRSFIDAWLKEQSVRPIPSEAR